MIRIGTGAGFSSDRLTPAVDLARDAALDWLVFETIGERTLAFAHRDRRLDPASGFNPRLDARLRAVLPHCRVNGTRIITNMGVANVAAAGQCALRLARELVGDDFTIALVYGDDVTSVLPPDTPLEDLDGAVVGDLRANLIGANAYLGIDAILPAIDTGADLIITGRVADPSLFLAPAVSHFGWLLKDWPLLGKGTLAGHLMECGMQVTGGYFADPGFKDVSHLADCGYPIAELDDQGDVTITKLEGTGGVVNVRTVKEQLLYEVHDPSAYLTPDVTADFSNVLIREMGHDRVRVSNASGCERPDKLKVTVGLDGGYLGEAEISYAGAGAAGRARLAREVLKELLDRMPDCAGRCRLDLIGVDAVHGSARLVPPEIEEVLTDVRLRVAVRSTDQVLIDAVLWEIEALLCCGPAGGGGFRSRTTPSVVTHSALIDRGLVQTRVEVLRA